MSINILAIDTATEACSAALLYNDEVSYKFEINPRGHTKRILPIIDELLRQSNVSLNQLDAIAFGRGPGSFTGVRIGTGITQGLAFGADLPVIPISNLTAMAQFAYEKSGCTRVISAIDARMSEIYFSQLKAETIITTDRSEFIEWRALIDEQVCAPDIAKIAFTKVLEEQNQQDINTSDLEWLAIGTGWQTYPELLDSELLIESEINLPSAEYMLLPALLSWHKQQIVKAEELEPVYLRNKVAWKKLPGKE